MASTIKPIIKVYIIFSLFFNTLIFSQEQCPPAFISGVPLDQSVALSWEKPDTLSGYGVEVYSQCFTICSSEGMTIEHIGQDSSGGWFRDNAFYRCRFGCLGSANKTRGYPLWSWCT